MLCRRRPIEAHPAYKGAGFVAHHVLESPGTEMPGKNHGSETHASEPTDRATDRLEELAYLAVASFPKYDVKPSVLALPSRRPQRLEPGFSIVQHDPVGERAELLPVRRASNPHRVLAFDAGARMHEPVGQLTVVGEQKKSRGIDVQPADRNPSIARKLRKPIEHRRTGSGVAARRHLASRLVVANQPVRSVAPAHQGAVDTQHVAGRRAVPERRGVSVDGDPTRDDPAFRLAS